MGVDEARELAVWAEAASRGRAGGISAMRALRADQIQDLVRAWLILHGESEAKQLFDTIKRRRGDAA